MEHIRLKLPLDLACCLVLELSRSSAYTLLFTRWITQEHNNSRIPYVTVEKIAFTITNRGEENVATNQARNFKLKKQQGLESGCSSCKVVDVSETLNLKDGPGWDLPVDVALVMEEPLNTSTCRDLAWSRRLDPLVIQKLQLETLFSYLCTLGGAFSAMGDYYDYHANQAGVVSLRQLKVATTLGDPVLLSCCYLWYAVSLMQKGHFRQAEHIISKQYQFSKSHEAGYNQRLQKMCQGIWCKLRATKRLVRKTQTNPAVASQLSCSVGTSYDLTLTNLNLNPT